MKETGNPQHDTATRWFRAEHAGALPKKFAAAMNAGYAGMNLWALADIPILQTPRITSDWFYMGMIELTDGTWNVYARCAASRILHVEFDDREIEWRDQRGKVEPRWERCRLQVYRSREHGPGSRGMNPGVSIFQMRLKRPFPSIYRAMPQLS